MLKINDKISENALRFEKNLENRGSEISFWKK